MEAGKLRQEIIIQQYSSSANTYGEIIKTWSTYLSCYAEVLSNRGSQKIEADKVKSDIDTMFRVRWDSGIRTNMRISYKNVYYNIVNIDNYKDLDVDMILSCKRFEDATNG